MASTKNTVFLFADILPQDENCEVFGPFDENNFIIHSEFEVAENTPAIAVVGGEVYAVQNADDPDYINLILRPNPQEMPDIFGYKIEFMVYKRVLKSSLFDTSATGDQLPVLPFGTNDLVDRIWNAQPEDNDEQAVPGSKTLGLHLTNDDTDPIDFLFQYDMDYCPIQVEAGDTLGILDTQCFFEVYTFRFIIDHPVSEARSNHNIISINNQDAEIKQRHDREKVLNYIDPAALYGEFCAGIAKIIVKGAAGENQYKDLQTKIAGVLNRFKNNDKLYLDIRNDNFYSYNFYNQFDINDKNITYQFEERNGISFSKVTQMYGASNDNWPILIIDTTQIEGDLSTLTGDKIQVTLELVHYPDTEVNVSIVNRGLRLQKVKHGLLKKVIYRLLRKLKLENGWTTPFSIELNFDNATEKKLIASYTRLHYFKTNLEDTSAQETMPKKGFLDNLFPLIELPKLTQFENNMKVIFPSGFQRFVFFDHSSITEDHSNIPFTFQGFFSFSLEYDNVNNRVTLLATTDELFNAAGKSSYNTCGMTRIVNLDSANNFQEKGSEIGLTVKKQIVKENGIEIAITRYEPDALVGNDLPIFELQPCKLALHFTLAEYEELLTQCNNNNLDADSHLRFLSLDHNQYSRIRFDFEGSPIEPIEDENPRFIHYYKISPIVKGLDNNGDFVSSVLSTPILRSFNQMVCSTQASVNTNKEVNLMSDHYFLLPDEVQTTPQNIQEIIPLKDALREVYDTLPNLATAFYSLHIHKSEVSRTKEDPSNESSPRIPAYTKVSIGLFKTLTVFDKSGIIPIFGDLEQLADYNVQANAAFDTYPYKLTYLNHRKSLEPQANIGGLSRPQTRNFKTITDSSLSEQSIILTGLNCLQPYDIFNSRPNDFITISKRFDLVKLFFDTGRCNFSVTNFMNAHISIEKSFKSKDIEKYVIDLQSSILKKNETDIHNYLDLVFNKSNPYRTPTEIAQEYQPRFNYRRNDRMNLYSEAQLEYKQGMSIEEKDALAFRKELNKLRNFLCDLLFPLPDVVDTPVWKNDDEIEIPFPYIIGPFLFYGDKPNDPEIPPGSGLPEFGGTEFQEIFADVYAYYQGLTGSPPFTYKDYLGHILMIIECLTHNTTVDNNPLLLHQNAVYLEDSIITNVVTPVSQSFFPHNLIVLNASEIEGEFNFLSSTNQNKVRKLYYADVIAHELGHAILSILNPVMDSALTGLEMVHNQYDTQNQFPNFPYNAGDGHIRGSISGNVSCCLGNHVEKMLNEKYRELLEGLGGGTGFNNLYQRREDEREEAHIYQVESNNLPTVSPHGYCFNNMDPITKENE